MRFGWALALIWAGCTRGNPGLSIEGDDLAVPADLGGVDFGAQDLSTHDFKAPHDFSTPLDFGAPPGSDLATPLDFSLPLDFSTLADLASNPDLAGQSCVPASATATQFVDPLLGTDDNQHGGASGSCAYKTLTYALGQADGVISLAASAYQAPSETLPFTLNGAQSLKCNGATLRGAGGTNGVTVQLSGEHNALDSCIVDGSSAGTICIYVDSTPTTMHTITACTVTRCGGTGIYVAGGPTTIASSTVSNVALDGILWYAQAGTMTNNNFSLNTRDIDCPNSSSGGITGSGNKRAGGAPVCMGCSHCPF
jgi:hypothetical protein